MFLEVAAQRLDRCFHRPGDGHASAPISSATAAPSEPSRIAAAHRLDVAGQRAVLLEAGRERANELPRGRNAGAGRERRMELHRLRPREQLDREHALGVRQHLPRLQPGRIAHRDVILLPGARRYRVHARGMREHLVLADERSRHVLRNHEPGVEAAVDREKSRQPLGQRRVDHALGTALGDGRQLRHRDRQRVERERDRLAVEVSVGHEHVVVDEHERVVGRGVQLGRDHVVDIVEQVAGGAVHLRRATERIGILHLVAPAVRLDDRRAFDQTKQVLRRRLLPAEGTQRVDLRQEARARAVERLDGHRTGDVGRDLEPARTHEAERAHGCHELRAVDERQPLLRAKL